MNSHDLGDLGRWTQLRPLKVVAAVVLALVCAGGCGRDSSTLDTGTPTSTEDDSSEIHCTIATLPASITSPILVDDNYLIGPAPADAEPAVTADQALDTAYFNEEHRPYTATLVTLTVRSSFRGPNDPPPPTDWDRRARTIDHELMWLLVNVHEPEQIQSQGAIELHSGTSPTIGDSCWFTKSATFIDAANGDGLFSFMAN